jgi:hypothetical protein
MDKKGWKTKFESLKYRGGEMNEHGEVFQAVCDLAYRVRDDENRIEYLYDWADCVGEEEYDEVFQYQWGW